MSVFVKLITVFIYIFLLNSFFLWVVLRGALCEYGWRLPSSRLDRSYLPHRKTLFGLSDRRKEDAADFATMKDDCRLFVSGNEFLTVPSALEAKTTRTVSLLATDVKTRKLVGVPSETMEKALRSFNIATKVWAKGSNAMWNILLGNKKAAEKSAGSILTTKSVKT